MIDGKASCQCIDGWTGVNCDKPDFCYNNNCDKGTCQNSKNIMFYMI